MKKFIMGLLTLSITIGGIIYAWNIGINHVTSQPVCNNDESKIIDVYMTWDTYTIYPYDAYWNNNSDVLLNNKTSVELWNREWVLSSCDDWVLMSNYIKKGHPTPDTNRALILRTVNDNWCILHKPTTPRTNQSSVDAIIHYTIWFKKKGNDGYLNWKFYYRTVGNTQYQCLKSDWSYTSVNNVSQCPNITVWYNSTQGYHTWECLKYRVFRCGDGQVTNWEICDPKAQPWVDNKACDPTTCKGKTPVCNSSYSGQTVSSLVPWNYLCNVWTMTDFHYNESTRTWTWKCDNVAWTATNCSAKKASEGTLDVKKTLSGTKYVTAIWQELVWQVKVTANWWDVENVKIKDYLPSILTYKSMSPELPAWVTMVSIDPERWADSKGNYLLWTTEWILESWKSIILTITTKVNTMPSTTDNYENVACAWTEWLDEKCDHKPVSKEWELVIKKTLIWKKTVENTGDILRWQIEITANWWDVSGFTLVDKVPVALEYQNIAYSWNEDNLDIGDPVWPVLSWKYNIYTWNVKWTLKAGHKLTLVMTTKVVKMPTSWDDYKNVACVIKNGKEDCDDDKPDDQWKPNLRIKKTFTDGSTSKTVKVWDEISYRIDFGNNGNAPATITSIKDFLPKNVQYKTGSIHISRASTYGNSIQTWDELVEWFKIVDGVRIEVFGWMTLQRGDTWYIIITWIVKGDFTDNRTNFACIYLNDEVVACSDATHDIKPDDMKCENLEVPAWNLPNGWWSKDVRCTAWGKADLIEIDCGNGTTITWANKSELKGTCTYPSWAKTYSLKCTVKKDGKDYTSNSCNWSVTVNWTSWPSCFIAWTKVTMADGSQKNIEDVEIWEKVLWSNGTINTVLWFHRPLLWEKELWSINGWEYFVTAEHPFMTTEWWKSLNPELTKIWMENLPVWLLKVGDTLITENWNIEIYSLDAKKSSEDTQLYNFKLDGDHTYYADNYLVHNKWWSGTPTCKDVDVKNNGDVTCTASSSAYFKLQCGNKTYYSHEKKSSYTFDNVKCNSNNVKCSVSKYEGEWPWTSNSKCVKAVVPEGFEQCFNVNAWNFSIEEWEIFPFFWNMHNLEVWIDQNKEDVNWYTEIESSVNSYKHATDNLENYKDTECDEYGTIAKDSMVCTFKIYGWWENQPLYTIEWPCLSKDNLLKESGLINAWYNAMTGAYCGNSSKCYFSLDPERKDDRALLPSAIYYIENFGSWTNVPLKLGVGWDFELFWNIHAESTKPYWEYRIVLDNVKYLQCMGNEENPTWQQTSPEDYFTPCQNNFVLTDPYTVQKTPSGNLTASTDKLSKYRYLSGSSVFSDLLNAVQTTAYTPNDNVNKAMKKFVDKYSKLAVSVNVWNSSFLQWNNIKKVPWKSIYFVSGDITINWGSNSIDNPFTIVQTSGKTTIKWNVKHNMMLLTYGNIEFKWTSCNEDQTVKWIFYAAGNLSRAIKYRNNKSDATTWCTKGWLHVQWVLIWNKFNKLMEDSRSHLNDWFNKEDKKKSVMDWASVLIEYSPTIFTKSTMPPGAEDFTTALSIYKQ